MAPAKGDKHAAARDLAVRKAEIHGSGKRQ